MTPAAILTIQTRLTLACWAMWWGAVTASTTKENPMRTLTAIALATLLATPALASSGDGMTANGRNIHSGVTAQDNSGRTYDLGTKEGRKGYARAREMETKRSLYWLGGADMVNSIFGAGTIRDDPGGAPNSGWGNNGR
jgi:hypothetical protein